MRKTILRQQRILHRLHESGVTHGYTNEEWGEELGVSARTAKRDLATMRRGGLILIITHRVCLGRGWVVSRKVVPKADPTPTPEPAHQDEAPAGDADHGEEPDVMAGVASDEAVVTTAESTLSTELAQAADLPPVDAVVPPSREHLPAGGSPPPKALAADTIWQITKRVEDKLRSEKAHMPEEVDFDDAVVRDTWQRCGGSVEGMVQCLADRYRRNHHPRKQEALDVLGFAFSEFRDVGIPDEEIESRLKKIRSEFNTLKLLEVLDRVPNGPTRTLAGRQIHAALSIIQKVYPGFVTALTECA
jgi:hypothetical protein